MDSRIIRKIGGIVLATLIALPLAASKGSDDSNSSSSGSSQSGKGNSESGDDNSSSSNGSSGNSNGNSSSSVNSTESTRQLLSAKSRSSINGFEAEFEVRVEKRFDRVTFHAEASSLNVGAGIPLAVCLQGTSLGSIVLSSLNRGELELDSRLSQNIPQLSGTAVFELRRSTCTGAIVMSVSLQGANTSSNATAVQNAALLEGRAKRNINGFQAEFNVRLEHRDDRTKFRAEASNLNLGASVLLDVCRNGLFVGSISLNSANYGELELDSRLGAELASYQAGDTFELRRGGCQGELLLSAALGSAPSTTGVPEAGAPGQRQQLEGSTHRVIDGFEAQFKVRVEQLHDRIKLRAEVSNLNLPSLTRLAVCLGSATVGQLSLNTIHFAELELDSRLGQPIPAAQAGQVFELRRDTCSTGSDLLMTTRLVIIP